MAERNSPPEPTATAASPATTIAGPPPPRRRDEFFGIAACIAGLILLGALVSYRPDDPSIFSAVADPAARPRNWAGRVGASFADGALQFFGLGAVVVPFALLGWGVRRFRARPALPAASRMVGLASLLFSSSALAGLAFGRSGLFGGGFPAGGFVGDVLSSALGAALGGPGAALLLFGGLLVGSLLVTSRSLGDGLRTLSIRAAGSWRASRLERERRLEQKRKEEQRRDVVRKHLERARDGEAAAAAAGATAAGGAGSAGRPGEADAEQEPGGEVVYIPSIARLRVREKTGPGRFSVTRSAAPAPVPAGPRAVPEPSEASAEERGGTAARSASPAGGDAAAGEGTSTPPARNVAVSRPAQLVRETTPQRILPFPAARDAGGWVFPPVRLLRAAPKRDREKSKEEFRQTMELISAKCLEFGVEGTVDTYTPGPVVTTYEFRPSAGVKVSRIASLENDLALALAAEKVRIERIPGRAAVGIEVPNRQRDLIALREVIESERFRRSPSLLTVSLGIDVEGTPVVADLARMPHLLVAGMTGAGKSVGVNGMITSILFKARPDEVKFIFVDPKMNDMKDYEDIPHLLVPVIVDPKKAANALRWAVDEMEGRYKLLSEWPGVRNIEQYNAAIRDPQALAEVREKLGDKLKGAADGTIAPMPYIVVVIDELADLMMTAPREIEESVARLAQKARAVGIHLILATQRPSVDVITGTIKANLPCRVAYTTRTKIDARTILDATGAEALLGAGDMLYLAPGTSTLQRIHGGYVGGDETREICRFLKKQGKPVYDETVVEDREAAAEAGRGGRASADDADPMYDQAARLVVRERMASISFLQRRLEIGFSRAGKLVDMMQRDGIVGPPSGGSKSREVLVPSDYYEQVDRRLS